MPQFGKPSGRVQGLQKLARCDVDDRRVVVGTIDRDGEPGAVGRERGEPAGGLGRTRQLLAPDEVEHGDLAAAAGDEERRVVGREAETDSEAAREGSRSIGADLFARRRVEHPDRPRER